VGHQNFADDRVIDALNEDPTHATLNAVCDEATVVRPESTQCKNRNGRKVFNE
jgi:hypothetical protein